MFLFFAALGLGSTTAMVAGLVLGYRRLGADVAPDGFVIAGVVGGFLILGLSAWIWVLFDTHVARPIERLSGALRARGDAGVTRALDPALARHLGDLAPAAADVTRHLSQTRAALNEAVARETWRIGRERDRLEALLSDVPVGVLLCSADHQVVFYNGQAVDLLGGVPGPGVAGTVPAETVPAGAGLGLGLDRDLFDYLHRGPIMHAHDRLLATEDPEAASDLLCSTMAGGGVLAARMRLLSDGADQPAERRAGYVLTLRDVSGDLRAHRRRDALIDELFDRMRRPAAALQSLIGVLSAEQGPQGAERDRVRRAAQSETAVLADAIRDLQARHEAGRSDGLPLAMTRASDLGDAVRARVVAQGGQLMPMAAPLMLRCDSFEMVAFLAGLEGWLRAGAGGASAPMSAPEPMPARHGMRLEITEDGAGALMALEWTGPQVPIGALEHWLDEADLTGDLTGKGRTLTGRRVLETHATEIWPEPMSDGRARLCMPLREARRAVTRPARVARAVVYDFDLLERARQGDLAHAPLDALTYVVFDTETTGLSPATDEIVQLAAQRIVNGRRVAAETFDTLVDPGRAIPAGSTAVHGISTAMVAGAPDIAEVGRRFHRFAAGAVLVAHNAPFDMEFLRRKEAVIGQRFDHPVLDTVLLSAVIFGQGEDHSLDALCHRLGITIPEEARHTALGDTIATAEAFLRLIPALKARGLVSFGMVVDEVRKHGRLLRDLNS